MCYVVCPTRAMIDLHMNREGRPLRASVVAAALMALVVAGAVKLALWLPGAIERAPARGKAFEIPGENQDPSKVLAEARRALERAETVTVHWLFTSPVDEDIPADVREKPRFHGFPILGSAVVKSKQAGQQVLQSVLTKADPDPESLTGCFDPQHGIEVKLQDGRSIDLVICYYCWQMKIFDGAEEAYVSIGTGSEPLLNKQLKAGGVEYVDRLGSAVPSLPPTRERSGPS